MLSPGLWPCATSYSWLECQRDLGNGCALPEQDLRPDYATALTPENAFPEKDLRPRCATALCPENATPGEDLWQDCVTALCPENAFPEEENAAEVREKITDLKFKGRGQRNTHVTDASPELLRRCYLGGDGRTKVDLS